jgi:LPXTG-site transpeptidase (sortase) family protein
VSPERHRWIVRALVVVAVVCLGWAGFAWLRAAQFEREGRDRFEQSRENVAAAARPPSAEPMAAEPMAPEPIKTNDVIGILEIPRLGFSEIVAEGDGDDTLDVAIGHLPDTPLPWHPGNSAMAGHRDAQFRPLKDVRVGDRLLLQTQHGTLEYELRETLIVDPDDVWVLDPTDERTLTLITCYPFYFVGNAPQRFVIKAEAVDDLMASR